MTIKQTQCLLCYLNLYTGALDGIEGKLTRQARAAFESRFGPFSEEALLAAITKPRDFWQQIPNFTKEEFRCRCGGKYCTGFPAEPEEALVRLAQQVRSHFGQPVTVSSGVRCQTHNQSVGGAAGSRHRYGKAMDFTVKGHTSGQVLDYVNTLPGIRYAYAIDGAFVHMDVT